MKKCQIKYWNAAVYLRTSKGVQEDPDNTLQTQLAMIMDYLDENDDIKLCSVKIDNGHTGLNFNRPAYRKMMEEIRAGMINCVVVKDLSRFSRNHLDASEMLFQQFDSRNIRFIAIQDDVDLLFLKDEQRDFMIPLRTLMNQMYSMDISKKTSSQLKIKREQGEFVGGSTPYGYKRSSTDRHQLEIDEPAASVVRDIFRWRLEGQSADRIAQRLNEMGISTPAEYKQQFDNRYSCHFQKKDAPIWFAGQVIRILRNRVYTGALEQGKTQSNPLHPALTKQLPESEWAVKEDAHEAIISKGCFEAVRRLLKTDARTPPDRDSPYLFSGLIRCASCGNALTRKTVGKYHYYCCSLAKTAKGSCIGCQIPVKAFDLRAQEMIRARVNSVTALLEQIAAGNLEGKLQKEMERLQEALQAAEAIIERKQAVIRSLEPSMRDGIITKEEADELRAGFEAEVVDLEQSRHGLLKQIRQVQDGTILQCKWAEHFMPYAGQAVFSRKDIVMLVETIFVNRDKHIEIRFVHNQEFQYIRKILE